MKRKLSALILAVAGLMTVLAPAAWGGHDEAGVQDAEGPPCVEITGGSASYLWDWEDKSTHEPDAEEDPLGWIEWTQDQNNPDDDGDDFQRGSFANGVELEAPTGCAAVTITLSVFGRGAAGTCQDPNGEWENCTFQMSGSAVTTQADGHGWVDFGRLFTSENTGPWGAGEPGEGTTGEDPDAQVCVVLTTSIGSRVFDRFPDVAGCSEVTGSGARSYR